MRKTISNPTQRLHASVLTLFPQMFPGPLQYSIAAKAASDGIWQLSVTDLRDFATDKHKSVDDTPFGGGAGMVIRADVVDAAINHVRMQTEFADAPVIYFTPRGRKFDQVMAQELSQKQSVIFLCGRYEGVDERVIQKHNMLEISMGDFVLSGGELPALMALDAMIRLLPGTLGAAESLTEESFQNGLLEAPHYTKPADWQGMSVPEVLLSGHHAKIQQWRLQMAQDITRQRRPDLWAQYKSA